MHRRTLRRSLPVLACSILALGAASARADGDIRKVNHVVIVMQENHSFDNYFGVLPYVPHGPYHAGPCNPHDHRCVDGLTCERRGSSLSCANSNLDADAAAGMKRVFSFNETNYCPGPDLNHEWAGSHQEANYQHPRFTLLRSPNDGFVRVNDATTQPDIAGEGAAEDDTMGYYDQDDLPFYYDLAQTFAISDRFFSSLLGPTFPNRAYGMAATAFGHLDTAEIFPPPDGYKPITGTILDLLDAHGVAWLDFFSDVPSTALFRGITPNSHYIPVSFLSAFAPPGGCNLPPVSFVDSFFAFFGGADLENDEHPPASIKKGESFVSQIVNTLRGSGCWDDTVIFITYDEHGGFYDHVAPPPARQGLARNPDGIDPGLCADDSAPPASRQPGAGASCAVSQADAKSLCPEFNPPGPYPFWCPNFDQYGFRVPFTAVSPFSKPHYVSHEVSDHTSMLAFIEKRFLPAGGDGDDRPHLTLRDLHASTLEDLFDFDRAPSRNFAVPPPEQDGRCTQSGP